MCAACVLHRELVRDLQRCVLLAPIFCRSVHQYCIFIQTRVSSRRYKDRSWHHNPAWLCTHRSHFCGRLALVCYTVLSSPLCLTVRRRECGSAQIMQFESAEADCTAALRLKPTEVKTLLRRGTARAAQGNTLGAMQDYRHVLSCEHNNRCLVLVPAVGDVLENRCLRAELGRPTYRLVHLHPDVHAHALFCVSCELGHCLCSGRPRLAGQAKCVAVRLVSC